MKTVSREYMADKLAKDCNASECTMVHPNGDTIITVTVNGHDYDLTPWGVVTTMINGEKVRSDGPLFRAIYGNMAKKLGR